MNKRIVLVYFVIVFLFTGLIARLFYWQIVKASDLRADAKRQHQLGKSIKAPRGSILAADGSFLAGRSVGWQVYAEVPKVTDDKTKVSDILANKFIDKDDFEDESEYKTKLLNEAIDIKNSLARDDLFWVSLKRRITNEEKEEIEKENFSGIGFDPEELRVYPESSSAAQLLGFLGRNENGDDEGYFGLEGYYDLVLSGKPGFSKQDSDAKGAPIVLGDNLEVNATGGIDLVTHIDKGVEIMVEEKLKMAIERYGAKSGSVTIMNPKNGSIIAMATFPSFDPRTYFDFEGYLYKNPVITDTFEPGSIFKVVVMASALDSDSVDPDTVCDICDGAFHIDKYTIETWDQKYRKDSKMTDIIVNSDNVGMVFVSQKLGKAKMYDYLTNFGFGRKTGIDLQGEIDATLREKDKWGEVDLATASFGQGIAVTQMQIVSAVATIANDGVRFVPQVVDKLRGGTWEEDIKPVEVKRVISKNAADEITAMMVEAAKNGEAKWTFTRGFKVAGKTGTAQIPIAGHYDPEKTNASFVGFAPYDDPKFVMLVTLREPQTSQWASETAAPLWYDIAKDLFFKFGIQPEK